jgi:hypothetical protein
MASKFSASAAASGARKRPAEEAKPSAAASPAKVAAVPSASDIVIDQVARPQQQRAPQRLPTTAPWIICVYKVTDSVGDVWDKFQGDSGLSLYACVMDHACRPSALMYLRDAFNEFLRAAKAENDTVPLDVASLMDLGIRLVISDANDPDGAGFVQWRVCFYVAGDLKALHNFLILFDGFIAFKAKQMAKTLEVVLHPHSGIDLNPVWDDLTYEGYSLEEPAASLPLALFSAQPVVGKRVVCLHLQPETVDTISIIIQGQTWVFRSRFDEHGITGGYVGEGETRKCFRVMKSIVVSNSEEKARVMDMLGEAVFKNLAMRVVVDSEPEEGSDAALFISELRGALSLHFA